MPIGVIVDVGQGGYGIVRDEYGSEYTVHESELPAKAEEGQKFAYTVDISQNTSGSNVTTLRAREGE